MLDVWGQISTPATVAREPVFVSAAILFSLAYSATDAMDYDSLVTVLSAQIQVNRVLIGKVRKSLGEPIVLVKQGVITPQKAQKTIQSTASGGKIMLHLSIFRRFTTNDRNLHCNGTFFPEICLPVQCQEGAPDVHKYMPQALDGLKLFQWLLEVKHKRPCHCCLHGMVSHQLVFVTMQRRSR